MSKQMNFDPSVACSVVSCVGGVVGFWGLWRLCRVLSKNGDFSHSIALMAAGLAGGCTVLFFGHLELYTWPLACLLWLLAAAIDHVNGKASAVVVWAWSVVTLAMEMMFFPTILVIVLMLIARKKRFKDQDKTFAFGLSFGKVTLGLVCCSFAAGLFFTLVPGVGSFAPICPNTRIPYSVLSGGHLIDLFNLCFLVAPLLPTVLCLYFVCRKNPATAALERGEKLLSVSVLSLFLVTFWIDTELGALRDWDLLSFFGFPASVLSAILIIRTCPRRQTRGILTGLSICSALVIVAPHVAERTKLEKVVARLDPMVWTDVHYQQDYQKAYRGIPWAVGVMTRANRADLAEKYFRRGLQADSTCDLCWFNLGELFMERGDLDSAVVRLGAAVRISPDTPVYLATYAWTLQRLKQRDKLEPLLPQLAALETDNSEALSAAAVVLGNEGKLSSALRLLRAERQLQPWDFTVLENLGMVFAGLGPPDSAIYYLQKCIPREPEARREQLFGVLVQEQIKGQHLEEAQASLTEFRREFPNDTTISQLQSYLDRHK